MSDNEAQKAHQSRLFEFAQTIANELDDLPNLDATFVLSLAMCIVERKEMIQEDEGEEWKV